MATKKAASNTKKSTVKKPTTQKQATTKVTTVKAVESRPVRNSAATTSSSRGLGLMRAPLIAALIAEFIGTFILAGAIIGGQNSPIIVFFAFVGIVLAIGTVSGGYANPALVIGAWVTKRMSGVRAIAYIVAEVLGAMLALVVMNAFLHAVPAATETMNAAAPTLFKAAVLPKGHEWFIFLSEFVGTLIFGFAAASALRDRADRTASAFTIGLGAFLGLMVAGSAAAFLSANAILNPAIAISLQAIDFSSVWPIAVYVIGSILGAVIGFVLYNYLRNAEVERA
jgi:aquaporin Z